jgi:phosphoglycerate dehydrogenase-like enzyme
VDFVEAASDADVDLNVTDADVVYGYLNAEQFESATSLRWLQVLGAGVEGVLSGIPALVSSDVVLTNGRGAGAPIIGEHAVAMILALARQFPRFEQDKRDHRWDTEGVFDSLEYAGDKTVGIVGFGKSGRETGWRCKALGMSVLALDRYPMDGDPIVEQVWTADRLPELLALADYVVVTVPQTPETVDLIGDQELRQMKRSARLIVTSRGRIVNQAALVRAIKEGVIAGAGLDTVDEEPLPADDELWSLPNVIITPHIAGNAEPELLERRTFAIFAENLRRYLAGQPLFNVVDKTLGY